MKKFARRWLKTISIWSVICLVAFDSAFACRWRAAQRGHGRCCPSPEWSECCDFMGESPCEGIFMEEATPPPQTSSPSDQPAPPEPEPAAAAPTEPRAADAAPPASEPAPAPPAPSASVPQTVAPPSAGPVAPAPSAAALSAEEDDPFAPLSTNNSPEPQTPPTAQSPPRTPATELPPVDDDPFAPLPARPAAPPESNAKPAADPDADPFAISTLEQQPTRVWVDDTGYFRVRGRLIAVLDGKVRILKETGRTTTVSMSRLSHADREYVAGQ